MTADGLALPCVICFCDIPLADIAIHMKKYSQFGLSFSKEFLVTKGASPVFYIARNAASSFNETFSLDDWKQRYEEVKNTDRMDKVFFYDVSVSGTMKFLINLLWLANPNVMASGEAERNAEKSLNNMGISYNTIKIIQKELNNNPLFSEPARILFNFLGVSIFGSIKGFDTDLAEDDPDNYYMEREWRVVGSYVRFAMDDVRRVILPQEYAKKFRKDVPEYLGQIHFADTD